MTFAQEQNICSIIRKSKGKNQKTRASIVAVESTTRYRKAQTLSVGAATSLTMKQTPFYAWDGFSAPTATDSFQTAAFIK